MKSIGKATYLLLIGMIFMQAGACLFATTVNVSTLISEPPASLVTAQGPYAFNPDIFWESFPGYVMLTVLLAIIFNWKSGLRNWALGTGALWMLSGIVAILLLGPVQEGFLSTEYSEGFDPELKKMGKLWYSYSLLFLILSLLSGLTGLTGLFLRKWETDATE